MNRAKSPAGHPGPCRVLHIVGRMDRAGTETLLMNLYRQLDRDRIQFDFVYFTGDVCDFDTEIEALGGRIHRIGARHAAGRFVALYRLLRSGQWAIVHSHTLFSSGLHLAAARLAGVPRRIAHAHSTQDANNETGPGRLYQRAARRLIGTIGNQHVACSTAAASFLFPGRGDVLVLPNGVDIAVFEGSSRSEARAVLGIPEDEFLVLQVGRLMPVKNHARTIRIARHMLDQRIDFRMLFAGVGPGKNTILNLVDKNGLGAHVHLLGMRSDVPELMKAADVMILPSHYEGFSLALVEAQAAGLPSVVSCTVPAEADLGLGLVRFVRLEAPDAEWITALQVAADVQAPSVGKRRDVLERAGFSSASVARLLEQVYGAT